MWDFLFAGLVQKGLQLGRPTPFPVSQVGTLSFSDPRAYLPFGQLSTAELKACLATRNVREAVNRPFLQNLIRLGPPCGVTTVAELFRRISLGTAAVNQTDKTVVLTPIGGKPVMTLMPGGQFALISAPPDPPSTGAAYADDSLKEASATVWGNPQPLKATPQLTVSRPVRAVVEFSGWHNGTAATLAVRGRHADDPLAATRYVPVSATQQPYRVEWNVLPRYGQSYFGPPGLVGYHVWLDLQPGQAATTGYARLFRVYLLK